MPKVMPVGIRDETGAFIRQMAQGNEALARLYTQLLARYEERRMNEAFQREMFDKQTNEKRAFYDYTQGPAPGSDGEHPFGSRGAGDNAVPPAPAPAAPAARPPARPMPMLPGATPIPGQDSFTTSSNAPAPSTTTGSIPVQPGYDSFAQGGPLTEEFSSQSRIGQAPQQQTMPRTRGRTLTPPPGQLPRGTGMDPPTRRTRQAPAQAEFLPIQPEWLEKMAAAEKKYNVPQGSILALYGFENSGGRFLGKNKHSSAAGIFQFTEGLMREYKIDPALRNDPNVMIDLAARNMRRNADVLERQYKVKLEPNSETLPFFTLMHQLGVTDGPLVVRQLLANPNVPMTRVMADLPNRNKAQVLVNNGIASNATVGEVFSQHSKITRPWYDNGLKLMTGVTGTQPSSQTQSSQPSTQTGVAAPTTIKQQAPGAEATPASPTTASLAPRPPADIPNVAATGPQRTEPYGPLTAIRRGPTDNRGVNPRLIKAVHGGAEYLPPGYTIQLTSGARPTGRRSSQHFTGNASDWQIYTPEGKAIPNSGPDTTGMYTRLARGIKTWATENDPAILPKIGYGGAFETSRGSGRADLMHVDLGGSRGRLVPGVQFANLKPLAATDKRGAQVAAAPTAAPAQPQAPAMRQPKPSELGDVTGRFGVMPSEPLTTDTDMQRLARFGDPSQAPPIPRLAASPGGGPIEPQSSGLAARSDLDFAAMGPSITPQASGVAARSDLDYNMPRRDDPTVAPYEAAPEMPTQQAGEIEDIQLPPQPTPLQAPSPDMASADAIPQAPTEFEWPTEGMPTGPNIAGPPINMGGGPPNFPPDIAAPQSWELPDVASLPPSPPSFETSHNYDPSSREGRRIDANRRQQVAAAGQQYPFEEPAVGDPRMNIYDRLVRHFNEGANVATRPPPSDPATAVAKPTVGDVTKAIYGSEIRPRSYRETARGQRDIREGRLPATKPEPPPPPEPVPPSQITRSPFHEGPQAVVPTTETFQRNEDFPADFAKMKEILQRMVTEQGGNRYGERPPEGTPNSIMEWIKQKALDYQHSGGKVVKPIPTGADWQPRTPPAPAPGAKPVKPGDRPVDDVAPLANPPKVIPKPSSGQQPTVMPDVTKKTGPAAPQAGGGGPQVMGGDARKAAAQVGKEPGDNFGWINDQGVEEFGIVGQE